MFVTSGKVFGGWFDSWRLSPRTPRSYIAPGPNCPRFRRRRSVFVGRPVLVSVGRPCYPSNVGVGCMAEVSHNRVRRVGHVRGRPHPNIFSDRRGSSIHPLRSPSHTRAYNERDYLY